jgi:hypothetical protein
LSLKPPVDAEHRGKMNLTATLLTELAERKERVALLKFKLDGFAIALDMAGLASGAICAHPDDETQDHAIRRMPNVDEVLAVCAELRAEAKRYEVLKVQASHLGL